MTRKSYIGSKSKSSSSTTVKHPFMLVLYVENGRSDELSVVCHSSSGDLVVSLLRTCLDNHENPLIGLVVVNGHTGALDESLLIETRNRLRRSIEASVRAATLNPGQTIAIGDRSDFGLLDAKMRFFPTTSTLTVDPKPNSRDTDTPVHAPPGKESKGDVHVGQGLVPDPGKENGSKQASKQVILDLDKLARPENDGPLVDIVEHADLGSATLQRIRDAAAARISGIRQKEDLRLQLAGTLQGRIRSQVERSTLTIQSISDNGKIGRTSVRRLLEVGDGNPKLETLIAFARGIRKKLVVSVGHDRVSTNSSDDVRSLFRQVAQRTGMTTHQIGVAMGKDSSSARTRAVELLSPNQSANPTLSTLVDLAQGLGRTLDIDFE